MQKTGLRVPAGVSRDWLSDQLLMVCHRVRKTEKEKKKKKKWRRNEEEGRRYLSNDIIATEPVLVHDGDNYGGLSQHVSRHVKGEGLVENGV